VHCPVESFGLAFLNPPYDWTIGEGRNERMERVFLAHAYPASQASSARPTEGG